MYLGRYSFTHQSLSEAYSSKTSKFPRCLLINSNGPFGRREISLPSQQWGRASTEYELKYLNIVTAFNETEVVFAIKGFYK